MRPLRRDRGSAMFLAYVLASAFAHGGEDHSAPAAPAATVGADSVRVSTASPALEAVLTVPVAPPGAAVDVTLYLADYATSAPIPVATPALALSGPGSAQVAFGPTAAPGVYAGSTAFPAWGTYAGALTVAGPVSDILSVSGLALAEPVVPAATGRAGGLVGGAVAAVAALGVGYALGRRRGATAAALLAALPLAAIHEQPRAHGGEDHAEPAAPSTTTTTTTTTTMGVVGGDIALALDSQFLVGLRTAPIARDGFQEQVPALGRFVSQPGGSATLRSPLPGELVAPEAGFPRPGDVVQAGQVLAFIQAVAGTPERVALAQSRSDLAAEVAEARKAVTLAERDVAQIPTLGAGISERERLERQQSLEVARTRLRAAETALGSTGSASVPVRSPVGGRLGPALVRPGDQVQPGDPLFRVVGATGLWMEARLPERLATGVVEGAPATVIAAAYPDRPLAATILDAGQEADPATGMLTVTLTVDGADAHLAAGMGATAWLGSGTARDALVLPDAAVVDSNGIPLAFVKVAPERFELRELVLGARAGETWEVLGGLEPGERVVVAGTYPLRSLAGR